MIGLNKIMFINDEKKYFICKKCQYVFSVSNFKHTINKIFNINYYCPKCKNQNLEIII